MKKALMIGAMAVAAFVTGASQSAQARKYSFGFYTFSGGAYCNTLSIKTSGSFASGVTGYLQQYCAYPAIYVGGYEGSVKYLGAGKWFTFAGPATVGDYLPLGFALTDYINIKSQLWALALTSTYYGVPYELINAGELGPVFSAKSGGKQLGPVGKAFMSKFKAEHHVK